MAGSLVALPGLRCPQCHRAIERVRQHDDRDVFDVVDDQERSERRRGVAFCPHAGCGAALVVEVTRQRSMEPAEGPTYREPHAGLTEVVHDERMTVRTLGVFHAVHRVVELGHAVKLLFCAPLVALLGGPRFAKDIIEGTPLSLIVRGVLGLLYWHFLSRGAWSLPRVGPVLSVLLLVGVTAYLAALAVTLLDAWREVADLRLERRSMRHLRDRREVYVVFRPSQPPLRQAKGRRRG